ncbi:autotransporter domain-containing protein [Novosphingobium soli]|uniref:Autotransporter domain-containing protein n=1 Tax=Novosphingobium soli TaxID=574956 RepID=A0ABV6CV22_9SPHN
MRLPWRKPALAALLAAAPAPAFCAEEEEAAADAPAQTVAASTAAAEPLWNAAASAGVSARDDGPDGGWQSLSLTRGIGRGYVRAGVMRYHGTLLQADVALPSDYLVGTLGAGGNFANWVVDGWVSYGWQDYGRISTSAGSRASTGATGSPYFAAGGDLGRVLPLAQDLFLTPTVAGSFANGRLLRPAPTGSGLRDLETREPTWSANAAIRVDHAFGPRDVHYVGLSVSRNWTSNGVSALRRRAGTDPAQPVLLDSKHYADGWTEAGATTSMRLGATLTLDLFATRSFGVMAGNITAAGASLRRSF